MIIEFLGDSITEGCGASTKEDCFVSLIGKELGIATINHGIGGTRIARQIDGNPEKDPFDRDFNSRVNDLDPNADYIFVFGGTNDFGHGNVPIGTIEDTGFFTFYGALNILVNSLIEKYGKNKLKFILPLHRFNEDNPRGDGHKTVPAGTLADYIKAEINVFTKYGVEYLNLDKIFPKPKTTNNEGLSIDGLHPNNAGYRVIADYLEKYIKENLIK